ncbi:hypothetical protein MRY87_06805, partial [bacterium]|nr:hypothetical protein [bacterium]
MREHGSRARDSLEVLWVGDLSLFDPSSSDSLLLRHLSQHPVELDLALIVPERGASSSHFEGEFGKGIKRRGLFFVPRSPSPVGDLLLPFSQPMLPKEFFPYFSPKVSQAFQALLQGKVRQLKDLGVRGEMSALIPEWDAVVFSGLNGAVHLFDGKRFQLPPSFPPAFYHAPGV